MIYIRRFFQSTNIFILCCLLLALAFLFQCRVLYHAYQKRLRFNEYNEMINEMTQNLHVMQNVVNKTEYLMRALKKTVRMKPRKLRRFYPQHK